MKTRLQIIFYLLVTWSLSAQNTISNVIVTPVSGSLPVGTHIDFTYKYTQAAGSVKVTVAPSYKGAGMGYISGPTATYTTPTGSGSGFITLSDAGNIDKLHFKIFSNDFSTLLHETIVSVNITFVKFGVTNLKFTPDSPATLAIEKPVNFTYDYFQSEDTVKLIIVPTYTGTMAGYINSGTETFLTKTGSKSGFISLIKEGKISSLNFKFYSTKNVLLHEQVVPVAYTFVGFQVSNLKFTPPSPATLTVEKPVNFTYDYFQSEDTVKLIIVPTYTGTMAGYINSGTETFITKTGSKSGFISLIKEGKISSLNFKFYSTKNVLLHEQVVPVSYTFVGFQVSNVKFTPASPDTLEPERPVNFTYDYFQSEDTVKLIIVPTYTGSTAGYSNSGSRTFLSKTGSTAGFVSLLGNGKISGLTFKFYSTKNVLLHEQPIPVNFTFIKSVITGPENMLSPEDLQIFPVPANEFLTINLEKALHFQYEIVDAQGKLIMSGESRNSELRINTGNWSTGIYTLKVVMENQIIRKKIQVQ